MAFLDETGLAYLWNQILARLNKFVPAETGKGLSSNDYTTEEKEKLAGIEEGANKIIVDSALSSTSTNPVQNKIINTKFDSIQADIDSKVDKVDGKGLSTNDLTATLKSNYDTAYTHSQSAHAPADAEANVIVGVQRNGVDLTIDSNKKVNVTVPTKTSELTNDSDFATTTDLDAKVDKVTGKGLSTNDYTTEEKTKLSNIEDGANKTIVDTALSSTSTNPVQNKVINSKFVSMQSDIDSKVPSARTINGKTLSSDITLSASDVGALPNTTQIPSIEGLASESYVDGKVAALVDSAPGTLDTLNELAAALGDDPNFATTVATQIGTKVDKIEGKGLSTNDYTTDEKNKLAGISEGAQVNQNAFSNVIVGATTIAADDVTDTLTLVAGDNVTINPDASNDKITISAIDTTYNAAGIELGLVKSGGDATISNGIISVNDNSHSHVISNVDGLQAALDEKVPSARTVNGKALSADIELTFSDVGAKAASETDVFIALYGSTTFSEIQEAYNAGKSVFCANGDYLYSMVYCNSADGARFTMCDSNDTTRVTTRVVCTAASVWTTKNYNSALAVHTHSSEDIILTDTVTGTQYQLFMTNGKLTAVVLGEEVTSNYDNGDEVMY